MDKRLEAEKKYYCINSDDLMDKINTLGFKLIKSGTEMDEYFTDIDSEYIRTPSILKVQLPSSDFKVFSPANFLDKLVAMRTAYTKENETLLSRYAWMGAKELGVKLGAGYKKNRNF